MKIIYNGEAREVRDGLSLGEFIIDDLKLVPEGTAVAVDGAIVKKTQWQSFMLKEGMNVDVFSMVAGG